MSVKTEKNRKNRGSKRAYSRENHEYLWLNQDKSAYFGKTVGKMNETPSLRKTKDHGSV